MSTPRGVLRSLAFSHAEELGLAALDGALSTEVPQAVRAAHALKLIDAVDPPVQATVTTALPSTPEGVAQLSLSQLLSIAEENGLTLPSLGATGSIEPVIDG